MHALRDKLSLRTHVDAKTVAEIKVFDSRSGIQKSGLSVTIRPPIGSIQRFHLHDRGAVIASGPESGWRRRVVDIHAADVG
jgi:hypothetical protein